MPESVEFGDALAKAVHNTIHEVMAQYGGGGLAQSYTMMVSFIGTDGNTGWATCHGPEQTMHETLGLIDFHKILVERQVNQYMDEEGD